MHEDMLQHIRIPMELVDVRFRTASYRSIGQDQLDSPSGHMEESHHGHSGNIVVHPNKLDLVIDRRLQDQRTYRFGADRYEMRRSTGSVGDDPSMIRCSEICPTDKGLPLVSRPTMNDEQDKPG